MIFGFNTDVKYGNTVYHVQSEAREYDRMLQTHVFVRGRCIGKYAVSYAERLTQDDFSERQMEQMLREQHKVVLQAVREGRVESVLAKPDTVHALKLEWLNAGSAPHDGGLLVRLVVTEGGTAVEGAQVTSRVSVGEQPPLYTQATTDARGRAELKIATSEAALAEAAMLVQATHSGRVTTRKFRLRKQSK